MISTRRSVSRRFAWVAFADAVPGRFLYKNVVQAELIVQEYEPLLNKFKLATGLTDQEIESWNGQELAYLQGLTSEPAEVALVIDYISLLSDLAAAVYDSVFLRCSVAYLACRDKLKAKGADFADGLRPPSAEEIAAKGLAPSAIQRLHKARMDAYDRYVTALDGVVAIEAALGVTERWTEDSQQYQDAVKRIAERDWRRALDRLEYLMVQRMFELAKSHTFGTGASTVGGCSHSNGQSLGYKLRQAIGKGLKSRSQAIRTAVTRYNDLAAALTPPAPSVDFTTLMEWTELQEFELLRHSRAGDVRDQPWAQPANRVMATKYYKLARAREELIRCRVETRRLVTAMADEEAELRRAYDRLLAENAPLAFELGEYMMRRMTANATHRARLDKLAVHAGFAQALVPGIRVGSTPLDAPTTAEPPSTTAAEVWQTDTDEIQEELDGPDTEFEQEVQVLHDYLAHVS